MDKKFFTLSEIASYLQISKSLIYKMCSARKIPFYKIGGQNRFDRQEIDEWVYGNKIA